MPVNRNALIRYKTIDKCLQNRYRKWTLDDLIEACSEAIYEYEGIDSGVSKRTVQADIQMMRSDKLGYNAPIVVEQRKYYTYEDPNYSITNIPLTDQDLSKLTEAVEFMKQFQGFSHFKELDGLVQKLEDHVYSQKTQSKPVVDIEKNDHLKGLDFLAPLYQAIIKKNTLDIEYQSFSARQPKVFHFHPYLLKEYRNRWFLVGKPHKRPDLLFLALDRMIRITVGEIPYEEDETFDADTFFKDAIGISVSPNLEPEDVLISVSQRHAPYVLTKPLHHSQKLVERNHFGIIISLKVQLNFELEKEILAFGEAMKVIAPDKLRRKIRERMAHGVDQYDTDINPSIVQRAVQQLTHRGCSILSKVYTKREIRKINGVLANYFKQQEDVVYGQKRLFQVIPELKPLVLNENIKTIVRSIDEDAYLVRAIYFDKRREANWFVGWHQDVVINVKKKIETPGYTQWTEKEDVIGVRPPEEINQNTFTIRVHLDRTDEQNGALKVLLGSHRKRMNKDEIAFITTHSTPTVCEIENGGIQLMKPLLIHASSKSNVQRKRRVIHLEFASKALHGKLEWLEKEGLD